MELLRESGIRESGVQERDTNGSLKGCNQQRGGVGG